MPRIKIPLLCWHSFQSQELLESYPNPNDTETHDKKFPKKQAISKIDDLDYHDCNYGTKNKTIRESPPRPRRNYQQQQWSRKDSMIHRKKNTTANYNVSDRRKRQYVYLKYIVNCGRSNYYCILEQSNKIQCTYQTT